MERDGSLLIEALEAIDPSGLDYSEWVQVGMALKHEGITCDVWDRWSQKDPRYKPNDCWGKWGGFDDDGDIVTGGTIMKMARDRGFSQSRSYDDVALEWDAPIIVDTDWMQPERIASPGDDWNPRDQIKRYLNALFSSDDIIAYTVQAFEDDDEKWKPKGNGTYHHSAGYILEKLSNGVPLDDIFGTINKNAGAWIRFNPLDGEGITDKNVVDFRYALVESDDLPVEKQLAIIRELELPCAAIVNSGGKSIHAIVHIDASSIDQYKERVKRLSNICKTNGLTLDEQNKNPSRLSRFPGFERGDRKQFLIDTNTGKASWSDWIEWIEEQADDLPDYENLADAWEDLPELSPVLIDGMLRQGHKMLIAGPSKAGKSFGLINLCISIAEGIEWLGFKCEQGRVLYVNLELDRASCLHRFKDEYDALGIVPENLANIDIWNLRGKSKPMDKLAPSLIRRALKTRPLAIIVDPIYKVITGDENSAEQMSKFCNQFDKIATEIGCSVIYCHHHSKGDQWGKKSMDRASGSGVFARDPDAIIDLIELEIKDDVLEKLDDGFNKETVTAWRLEATVREFPPFKPVNLFFNWPLHIRDSKDLLNKDITDSEDGGRPSNSDDRESKLLEAINNANPGSYPTVQEISQYLSDPKTKKPKPKSTIDKWIKEFGYVKVQQTNDANRWEVHPPGNCQGGIQ